MEPRSREHAWIAALLFVLSACQMNAPSAPAPVVTGTVRQVLPSTESALYVTAVIAVQNHAPRPVAVTRYRLEWPGGQHVGPSKPLELAASESRDWRVRVSPESGNLTALLENPGTARVVILDVGH